jgi:hypothetical protein
MAFLKKNNIKPFIVGQIPLSIIYDHPQRLVGLGIETSPAPPAGTYFDDYGANFIYDDEGTGGDDWAFVRFLDQPGEYIMVGDTVAWRQHVYDILHLLRPENDVYHKPYLFAHKSICYEFPTREMFVLKHAHQGGWTANVALGPEDTSHLYYPLGMFGRNLGKCVGVLKAFLTCKIWDAPNGIGVSENWGPLNFYEQSYRGATHFYNTVTFNQHRIGNLEPVYDAEEAITNWLTCIMKKGTELNSIFQSLMIAETKLRHEDRAHVIMKAFCASELESTAFPNICACLGRSGVEDALRKELDNNLVRMVCQSEACINGDRTGGVYTFTPSPPCAPINICKPGLDVDSAKVKISNVTFNCNFAPGGNSAPVTATNAPDLTTPKATDTVKMSKKTIIIAASSAGAVLLLVVIIIAVIVRKKKMS